MIHQFQFHILLVEKTAFSESLSIASEAQNCSLRKHFRLKSNQYYLTAKQYLIYYLFIYLFIISLTRNIVTKI